MMTEDPYPGRILRDEERSPVGLGWEYARRGWRKDRCPLHRKHRAEFFQGFDDFVCTNIEANDAMLERGVPVDLP